MKIEITNNKLPGLSAALHSALSKVVEDTAREIETAARTFAPVDSGHLRDSITSDSSGLSGSISVGAPYGFEVEFGTEHTSPQPFLTPAISGQKEAFERRIGDAVRNT